MCPNRAPRFPDFDYRGFCRYFLTICVYPRRPVFADLDMGRWVRDQLLQHAARWDFAVIAYCVMPDHLHVLAEGTSEQAALERFVTRFKQATGYEWKRRNHSSLWQEGYFDRVLRDEDPEAGIVNYIVSNPVRSGIVDDPADYPLSGSSRYTYEQLADVIADWSPFDECRRRRD